MPEQRIRIGLAGVGFIGRRHVGYLRGQPIFDLVAAADPGPGTEAYCRDHGIPHYGDYRRMLAAERPDGVVVATPNALHEEVAVACIEAGIPVLVEKPIADSLDSAFKIVRAAERHGVQVLVGHHRRHNPLMRAARAFLDTGALGTLLSVAALDLRRKADSYYDMAWRREAGGGPMLINGIHDIDCLRHLCGEVETVFAMTSSRGRSFAVEDTASVTLRFAGGAIGNLTLSDAVQAPWAWEIASGEEPDYPRQLEEVYHLCGTEGSLAIPSLTHWRNERGGGRADPFLRKQLFYIPAVPWVEELLHFAQVIKREAQPLVSAEDGARTLAVVMAIGRSAATGQPIPLSEFTPTDGQT